jgi:2-keto-4-pentenoate hydratase/2-oxohepta-3-ene-1,7-dioic acid hydratase in catechol pathway
VDGKRPGVDIGFARARTRDAVKTGVVVGGRFVELRTFGWPGDVGVGRLFGEWAAALALIRSEVAAHWTTLLAGAPSVEDLSFAAPLAPTQIFQVAQNYADHARELGERLPSRPYIFSGLPSAICGATDDVMLPAHGNHDWEIELGVVIKTATFMADAATASSNIAGYVIANDITTRDALRRTDIDRIDYIAAKNRPTFLPLGPYFVPADQIRVDDLRLRLHVNGELRQDGTCRDLAFSVPDLVSILSRTAMLLPEDLVLTGTPAGTGHATKRYLQPGDVIDAEVDGLGRQRNRCALAD